MTSHREGMMISKGQIVIGAIGCAIGYSVATLLLQKAIETDVLYGIAVFAFALILAAIISPARRD